MKKIFLLFILFAHIAVAQQQDLHPGIPKDTSFNVQHVYQQQHEQYPFISIVQAKVPKGVRAAENIVYTAYGDRKLHLDLFYPAKKKSLYPGVVLIHGGGWRSGDKSLQVPMAQHLAAKGYVTAAVEYRLSMEALYPAAVHDVKAAIRWMRAHAAQYSIDTIKIAVLGCSAGGQLAALMGTTNGMKSLEGKGDYPNHASAVQATIDIDGVLAFIHPESAEGQDKPGKTSAATYWFGSHYTVNPAPWREASALTHVDRQTTPFLFINSAHPRFHAGQDDMIAKLDSLGIYSEVHTIPATPHPFWLFHPWFDQTFDWVVDFLDKMFKEV